MSVDRRDCEHRDVRSVHRRDYEHRNVTSTMIRQSLDLRKNILLDGDCGRPFACVTA